MASSATLQGEEIPPPQESPPDTACREAQKWIEQVTGKSFGDKDFRTGLENGILLCELLNAIKPGLVKKINRLPTPIAGLDNITLFLRGCKELGLKESQLFDPGDLQDTANRTTARNSDCNRKLRNVLITVYWLGKAASSCSSYSGNNLDLKEFEGLLAQMRKENEEIESPKRSIRDSGYIDCWDSERSDSLSPPRHGRDDSFDSLDSFGSRSQQTPSPDVVLRGSSDGRGSDSESDLPHRRLPDVRKDDMSARRVSYGENKAFVPFNQYLPNKSNQTSYIPAPLRKKKAEREDYRKSWSTATSPLGGERPFSPKQSPVIKEEQNELQCEGEGTKQMIALKEPCLGAENRSERVGESEGGVMGQSSANDDIPKDAEEVRKRKHLQKAGIKVLPATKRYSSPSQFAEDIDGAPDIVLRKENTFLKSYEGMGSDSEEEEECKVPDIQRDDLATRRARMNQPKSPMQFNQYIQGSYLNKNRASRKLNSSKTSTPASPKMSQDIREYQGPQLLKPSHVCKEKTFPIPSDNKEDAEAEQEKVPDIQKDDLAKRKAKASVSLPKEPSAFAAVSITKADMETWQRLRMSSEDSEHLNDRQADQQEQTSKIDVTRATNDDFGRRKLSLQEKRARNKQKFVRFGPVTEIDQQKWDRLCIAKAESGQESEEMKGSITSDETASHISPSASAQRSQPQEDVGTGPVLPHESRSFTPERLVSPAPPENESEIQLLETQQDDMMARRTGTFQKCTRTSRDSPVSHQYALHSQQHEEKSDSLELEEKQGLFLDVNPQLRKLLLSDLANTSSKATSPTLGSKSLKVTKEAEDVKNDMKEGALNTGKDPNSVIPEDNTIAPDPEKDDMMTRKISVSQKPSCVSLGHFLPVPFSLQHREGEKKPTSCIISSTKKSKNASKAVPANISDVPSKPLDQKETKEHGELGDMTCKQASNSVETPMCTELDSQQQDGLERRMILSTDLANTELKITPPTLANNSPTITKVQEPDATISEDNTTAPNPEKDDMMTRRISVTQKPSCVGLGHFLPVPFSLQQKVEEKKSTSSTLSIKIKSDNCTQALAVGSSDLPCKLLGQCETEGHVELRSDVTCDQTSTEIISDGIPTGKGLDTQAEDALETCDHELFRFSPRSVLSDDGESMSMCDMRYEEEGSMQPHSRAHYEHLQHVNSLLKEEDDTWQDDLAKWKTRRRSASQDLIKKEEQRKKMERMMSGEDELSERRKSIKTYREIVEEKERREKELHEAYKNAKSRDEAEHILQSYIEKFTISEAVLEGLVMPKILERSQSVEPSLLSSSEDPNILKYLRQQSLPSPKYTSTVEATVSPSSPCEAKSPTGLISPSKNIISKTVPMLTAKPYSQPKNTQEVLKTFKVDGKVNLNGVEEQKEEEHGNQTFAPSLTRSQMFEGVARVDVPVVEIKQDVTSIELNLARPNTLNSLQEPKSLCEDRNHISQEDESDSLVQLERAHSVEILSEGNTQSSNATQDVPVVSSIEIPPLTINGKDTVDERKVEAAELIMHWSLEPNHKEAKENSLSPLKTSENLEESLQFKENVDTECTENSPALVPSLNSPNRFCTWDPEEERKRQEKWQQEQERLLQERYQREQEKLKEEWEKAQKEVEEEERKYYEEERKIIEDTVVPLTLSPNSNAQFNISERNGNFIPALTEHVKRDQENNNEKLLTESSRTIKNETHMHSNVTQQLLLHTQEGSILGAKEKQIKGKTDKWEAEQSICIMDREELSNHVQSNECNTPTRLPLQAGCKQVTSSESSLPGDLGSPKNPITEKDALQNMSSIIPTRGTDFKEDTMNSSQSSTSQCQSPNRSVSGKKLCSTCGLPLGKGAAMIIETLSLYFHIQCFKCGLCKGQLGDAITGTDVRIRNGLLNCNDCYMKSRTAGHPTPL